MKCDLCEKEAVVHLTQVINGEMKEVHLCEVHAAEQGIDVNSPLSITDILMGLGQQSKPPSSHDLVLSCPACGMSRDEFAKSGRLGCGVCYNTFRGELTAAIKALHHSTQHLGKIPAREGQQTRMKSQLARLQKELDEAVAREEYEKAASLRDKMKTLRTESDSGETT